MLEFKNKKGGLESTWIWGLGLLQCFFFGNFQVKNYSAELTLKMINCKFSSLPSMSLCSFNARITCDQQQQQLLAINNNIFRNREVLWGSENPHTSLP